MGDKKNKSKSKIMDSDMDQPDWMRELMREMKDSIYNLSKKMEQMEKWMEKKINNLEENMKEMFEEMIEEKMKPFRTEMENLKALNKEQATKIISLEEKYDQLDQQNKMNDIIITGLKIKPLSYARAVTAGQAGQDEEQNPEELKSIEEQVSNILSEKNIEIDFDQVEACRLLPWKGINGTKFVLMKFTNLKYKINLLKQGPKLKGSSIYFNENLTKTNLAIAKKARDLKKEGKITKTWTSNCRILIKTKGNTPEDAKTLVIRKLEDFDKFKI